MPWVPSSLFRFFLPASLVATEECLKRLALIGDDLANAKEGLIELLKAKGTLTSGGFDMEPFEVLLQLIDNPKSSSIGGNPQIVKVYKSMKTVPFVVRRDGASSLYGRTLLSYEVSDRFPTVDF